MTEAKWFVGQEVIINRTLPILHVDKVTPTGRAVVDGRTFDASGFERAPNKIYGPGLLEPMTNEIGEEIAFRERASNVFSLIYKKLDKLEVWRKKAFSLWTKEIPSAANVERAERLAAAIDAIMGEAP